MSNTELPTIDSVTLEDVTGGVTGSSSSGNSQVAALLQGLQSSIKDLAANSGNNSNNALTQLLPFLLLSKGGAGGGACPCGCGMANCMRR
jgi:hypothetical protein